MHRCQAPCTDRRREHRPRPLGALLDEAVARHGDRVALRIDDARWTYRDLAQLVHRTGRSSPPTASPGRAVALSAGNSAEFVAVVFATARLGATIVMISTAWRDARGRAMRWRSPRRPTSCSDGSGGRSSTSSSTDRPVLRHRAILGTARCDVAARTRRRRRRAAPSMVFSSGTTGLPKAVRHSHRTMFHGTVHWVEALGLTSTIACRSPRRRSTSSGCSTSSPSSAAGASVRLHRRFELDAVLHAIETRPDHHRDGRSPDRLGDGVAPRTRAVRPVDRCATSCGAPRRSPHRSPRPSPAEQESGSSPPTARARSP